MLRPSVLLLTLIVFLGCGICRGQVIQSPIITEFPRPADSAQPPKVDPETEKKALDLVEALSEQVVNLHASSNRVRAESEVADLLWVRDEKRARRARWKPAVDGYDTIEFDRDSVVELLNSGLLLNNAGQASVLLP